MKNEVLKLEWHALTLPVAPEGVKPGAEMMVDGEPVFVIRSRDYLRLLQAAGGDDMLMYCENCSAWIDREDPAAARIEDVSMCWAAATCREKDKPMCRRDRVSEVVRVLNEEIEARDRQAQAVARRAAEEAKRLTRTQHMR